MSGNVRKFILLFSPISRHFLSFLLFLDTFSFVSRRKSGLERGGKGFVTFPVSRHFWPVTQKVSDVVPTESPCDSKMRVPMTF